MPPHSHPSPLKTTLLVFEPPYNESQNIGIGVLGTNLEKKVLYQVGMAGDTINYPAFNKAIAVAANGDVYVGGNPNFSSLHYIFNGYVSWFMLTKLETGTFKPAWVKYYGGDMYYSMYGVIGVPDGGMIMYGSRHTKPGTQDGDAFLLKTGIDGVVATNEPDISSASSIAIGPNPFNDFLSLPASEKPYLFELFDIEGRRIKAVEAGNASMFLSVKALPQAAYFYRCSDRGVQICAGELVK